MSLIKRIQLETDLSEFDATVTDGGDLSWAAAAAMAGSNGGMSILIDDATAIYGQINAADKKELGYRFYFNPNTLAMANGDDFYLCVDSGNADFQLRVQKIAGVYSLYGRVNDDSGVGIYVNTGTIVISFGAVTHWIEVHQKRSTGVGANNGYMRIWLDKNLPLPAADASVENVDDDTRDYDNFLIGAAGSIEAGTLGTFYIDEIILRDDAVEIGPRISLPLLLRSIEKY